MRILSLDLDLVYRYLCTVGTGTPVPVLDLALALVEILVQGKLYVKVFPEVGKAGKVGSTASTVFYMPDAVQNSWQYTDRLPNSKKSGDCAKPPKSLEFVPNRDSVWEMCAARGSHCKTQALIQAATARQPPPQPEPLGGPGSGFRIQDSAASRVEPALLGTGYHGAIAAAGPRA